MSEVSPLNAIPTLRQLAMPKDTNALGTIFGGVILSQIDTAAAIEAHKHHRGAVVTVAMDEIEFKQPVFVGDVVSYYARTHKLGRTSVTIDIDVFAQRQFELRLHLQLQNKPMYLDYPIFFYTNHNLHDFLNLDR